MRFDLIIFDCDGVIADSEILSAEVLIAQLAELGIAVTPDDVRRDFLGRSFPTVAAGIRARSGRPLPDDFEASYRARLLERFEADLKETPGFSTMLAGLGRRCCVATSSSPPRVARTLAVLGLHQAFGAHVFTASEVARGKPAPDLFLHAAARMQARPDRVLVIEDSPPGLEAARSAGMAVLHYGGGAHLAGIAPPAGVEGFDDWGRLAGIFARLEAS